MGLGEFSFFKVFTLDVPTGSESQGVHSFYWQVLDSRAEFCCQCMLSQVELLAGQHGNCATGLDPRFPVAFVHTIVVSAARPCPALNLASASETRSHVVLHIH